MKRFIIVVYYWRRSQCSAKTECIQFSILKNACQPQLLSLKIGKKSLKIGKSETLENHFSFSMTFWQKSLFWAIFWIAFQHYVECTSWDFLAVQDSSHWLTYSFSLWVVFISPSWGQNCTSLLHHLDFGIFLGSSFASVIDSNFIDLVVWWLRDDTVYAKLWSNISSGGTSSKPSCKCGSKSAHLSRIVGGLESSVGVLFYFSWFQMILSQKHDWPWIVIFSHGTTDGSRMVGEIA